MSDCTRDHDHSKCNANITNPSVYQTLDELDFERGIWYAAQHGDLQRVEKLLHQGTSPNIQDSAGYTALHYAARNGHDNVCQRLISEGASVNATTKAGNATALHRAVSNGKQKVVRLLINVGADTRLVDADGKSVLHRAVESGNVDIVKALLERDPELKEMKDLKGNLPLDYVDDKTSSIGKLLI